MMMKTDGTSKKENSTVVETASSFKMLIQVTN